MNAVPGVQFQTFREIVARVQSSCTACPWSWGHCDPSKRRETRATTRRHNAELNVQQHTAVRTSNVAVNCGFCYSFIWTKFRTVSAYCRFRHCVAGVKSTQKIPLKRHGRALEGHISLDLPPDRSGARVGSNKRQSGIVICVRYIQTEMPTTWHEFPRRHTVAEHWIGFDSPSHNPTAWEKENVLQHTHVVAKSFISAYVTLFYLMFLTFCKLRISTFPAFHTHKMFLHYMCISICKGSGLKRGKQFWNLPLFLYSCGWVEAWWWLIILSRNM